MRLGSMGGKHLRQTAKSQRKMTPNPSIERTRPGKPGRASHVKR